MSKMTKIGTMLLSVALVATNAWPIGAIAQPFNGLPKHTTPLAAQEVRALYSDKTWQWEAGGGRFMAKNREFIAYSEKGGVPTIAKGRWEVTDRGRLCMVATWITKEGQSKARSCFKLVRDRGTIYQRREPDGKWYILRTFKPKPDDEFHKLVAEDTITPNIKRLEPSLK